MGIKNIVGELQVNGSKVITQDTMKNGYFMTCALPNENAYLYVCTHCGSMGTTTTNPALECPNCLAEH